MSVLTLKPKYWIHIAWLLLIPLSGNAVSPMVSLGQEHAVALRSDGTVVAWGSDQFGKLGTGRGLSLAIPAIVPGLPAMRAIGGGRYHSLAIGRDGILWAWGSNSRGQLGDGTRTDRPSPVQVPELRNAVMACGGAYYSVALKTDGTLWSWGDLLGGQDALIPGQVAGPTDVASLACGGEHFLALGRDGRVWAWGANHQGAIGDGTTTTRLEPVRVPGLADVAAIGAGYNYSAVLKKDGTVWEWGNVPSTGAVRLSPVQSVGVSGAVKMRAGDASIAAIGADGTTWWFWDSGTAPALQTAMANLESVVPAGTSTLLLTSDQTVMLGRRTGPDLLSAVPVAGLANIVALAGGQNHSLALDTNGNIWTWGSDANGQLGLGGILGSSIPAEVTGLGSIVQVSAGFNHNLALDQDGNVWAWGDNQGRQLGDGTSINRSAPVRLTAIADVRSVAAGNLYSIALKRDETVWAWGSNYSGELGNAPDSSGAAQSPVQVPGLMDVVAIAAGASHSLALTRDGNVWAWGGNDHGQLGLGTVNSSNLPAQVPGLSGVKAVAAGAYNSYAVRTDGTAMAWGRNEYRAVGDGSTTGRLSPVPVTGLTEVVEIAAGPNHVLARRQDGSVWGWGTGTSSELGPQDPIRTTPAPIRGITRILQVAAGDSLSGLVRHDGLVQMGGRNRAGQAGDGTYAQHPSFVLVENTSVNGFLNLYPGTVVDVPAELKVPFFLASYKSGSANSTSLRADLRGITASGPVGSGDSGRFAAGYNVYVAAIVPTLATSPYFQLSPDSGWSVLQWPMAAFLRDVALDSQANVVRAQILQGADLSSAQLVGTSVLVGYGTDPDEMVRNGRYRTIFTVPQP